MIGQAHKPPLSETADAVVRQLVGVDHTNRRSLIWLPITYPSGSRLGVRLTNGGDTYSLSDMALSYEESRNVRAQRAFNRHAPLVAEAAGVDFEQRSFRLSGIRQDQLPAAVIALANCAHSAVTLAVHKQAVADAREAEQRLFERLTRLFGHAEQHKIVTGASGTPWDVDAVVRIGDREILFEAVGSVKQSIYATVAKYHDIARLPYPPLRVASVSHRDDLGSMLGVLSQAATVIEQDTPDSTVRQLVAA